MTYAMISNAEPMSELQALTARAERLTQATNFWNTAMIWALIFAAIAAIAVVVTTRLALDRAKDLSDTERKIGDIKEVEGNRAKKEAADAQLKLDQWLANKTLDRRAQLEDFESLKRFTNMHADVLYKENDGEAYVYAVTILSSLKAAGWSVPAKVSPTRNNPVAGEHGTPIIQTWVLAKHTHHGAAVFEQMHLPDSQKSALSLLVALSKVAGSNFRACKKTRSSLLSGRI